MTRAAPVLLCLALGCSAAPQPTPCERTLAAIVLECRARKVTECSGLADDKCPLIAECDKRIDEACQ